MQSYQTGSVHQACTLIGYCLPAIIIGRTVDLERIRKLTVSVSAQRPPPSIMSSEKLQELAINGHSTSQPPTPAAVKASVAALQASFESTKGEPYDPQTALEDLPLIRTALQLFLESKMVESEDLLNERDPVK